MNETLVYTVGWIVAGLVVLGIVAALFFGVQSSRKTHQQQFNACIAEKGTYLQTGSGPICIGANGVINGAN